MEGDIRRRHRGSCGATHQSPEAKEDRKYLNRRQMGHCGQRSHDRWSPSSRAVVGETWPGPANRQETTASDSVSEEPAGQSVPKRAASEEVGIRRTEVALQE